jgi:hypothetical protein
MIEHLREALSSMLPLTIRVASFADPALNLAGDGWSLSCVSAWRVTRGGVLEFGWSGKEAADRIWDLCGLSIVSVAAQSPLMRGDPAFELSSGQWLEIFSDHPVDPWSLMLPTITFVGSPSDPSLNPEAF